MTSRRKPREELEREIVALRAQLAESREVLQAIREGDVDALVVSMPAGPRVFTLESADHAYRAIVEQMREGAVMLLEDGLISYANRSFAEMAKRPLDEVIGSRFREYAAEADRDALDGLIRDGLEGAARGELTLRARDGTGVPVRLSFRAMVLNDVATICAVVTDLTEHRRVERLLASEQFVRRLIDSASIGVAVVWRDMRYVLVNPAYEAIAERPILGLAVEEAWQPDVALVVHEVVRKVLDSGREFQFRDSEAPLRGTSWWDVSAVPLSDGTGDVEAVLLLVQETTERKLAEEALREAMAAAEAANEARSRLLANVSHELRTPMNAILGMIGLALPRTADPTAQDCLRTAEESADLLLTLLNDLLDSAKIESDTLTLELLPFSLRKMMRRVSGVLAIRASEKGLSFECHVGDDVPDAVVGDRTRLEQVLLNLIGNAIKFTDHGKVTACVHVSPHQPVEDGTVALDFSVRDTGVGIAQADLEGLFKPFVQADSSLARSRGGAGLGLSISKCLVEMMGGRVGVESAPGRGSTFSFTVRLTLTDELPPDAEPRAVEPAAPGRPLRVLLAEDNPANQKLAMYILRDRGHVVDLARDGREAVALAERNHYDVVLMDLQMPGMNGLDATAALRRREPAGRRVPIVAMTAHAMARDRERCLAAGMDGYLAKPINGREMIDLVESFAAGAGHPAPEAAAPAAEASPTAAPFDPDAALKRCFNSRDMLTKMIRCFYDDAETLLPQMRLAMENGDWEELDRLAHRVRGTLLYLAAEPAGTAAQRLERLIWQSGDAPPEAEEIVRSLECECDRLKAALADHEACAETASDR
jgi:PAS domain S-box-containing protein